MKKILILLIFLNLTSNSYSKHETFIYDFFLWDKYEIKGSKNYQKFNSELIKNKTVSKEIENSNKTGLISYLLFKENKIVVDESNLPDEVKRNNNSVTINKYTTKIENIRNEKIKKSLIELTKNFKKK